MFKQAKIKLLRWPFQRPDLKPNGNLWTAKKPGPLQETNQFLWSLRPLLCREVNHPTRMFPFCAHIYLPVGLELNWKKNIPNCATNSCWVFWGFFKSHLGCMLDNHSALGKEKSTITVTFMPMMTFVNLWPFITFSIINYQLCITRKGRSSLVPLYALRLWPKGLFVLFIVSVYFLWKIIFITSHKQCKLFRINS